MFVYYEKINLQIKLRRCSKFYFYMCVLIEEYKKQKNIFINFNTLIFIKLLDFNSR